MTRSVRILCIDDDNEVLVLLEKLLISAGHQVFATESVSEALQALETENTFDICLCDYQMPEMLGDDLLRLVAEKSPDTVRLLMSGYPNTRRINQATLDGACNAFIQKPINFPEFLKTLNSPPHAAGVLKQ
jgi:DNA-binding NtrC family response regulator